MKKNGWKIILAIAVLVCVVCFGRFGWIKYQNHKTEQARQETLKAIASTEFTGENDGDEPEKVPAGVKHGQKIDFKKLIKINSDIYAWIYVPGTRIDYPVAQNQEDDTHYLKYNFKNEPEFAGCIYTEKANKKDFTDPNTIFYGHNMRNGSMFQNLHKFEDEQFFNKHKEVYVYTPKKTYTYTIFAAYKFDDRHLLKTFNFKNKAKFENYLRNVKNIRDMESHIRTKQKVTSSDKIITLSTCVGGQPHNRYLVQAVLTDERSAE
ncbi:SrtB family sortase [Firmicutes bacterium AF12-30]|nr:SrtB family sortase [Firmicutes bacterium AF12-30]